MEKIHCNIIRDLLPSYVDEITSEESNQIIEEHFRECEPCKKVYESLKAHGFVADRADAGIAGYLEKAGLKKRIEHRGMLFLALLLFLLQNFLNFGNYVMLHSLYIVNCIFYPMYVILLLNMLGAWKEQGFCSKAERVILAAEGVSLFYIGGMFYSLFIKLENGETHLFGLALRQVGPFLACQIKVLIAVYLLALMGYFMLHRREKRYNQNIIIMLLAGAAILLNIRVCLYQMDSILPVKKVSIFLAVIIAEGILLWGLYRKLRKVGK